MYTTSQIATMFGKSQKTITRWVEAFPKYFSDAAKVTDSYKRFDDDDLGVLSLIHLLKAQGQTFKLIEIELEKGERAEPPNASTALSTKDAGQSATTLKRDLAELRTQIAGLRDADAQNRLLKEQNAELLAEIRKLEREKAVLEYRLESSKSSE